MCNHTRITLTQIPTFATTRFYTSHHFKDKPKPPIDMTVFDKVCKSIEILKIDSASDEVLSAQMMRGRTPSSVGVVTPNLRLMTRDAVHCARRTCHCAIALGRGGGDPLGVGYCFN